MFQYKTYPITETQISIENIPCSFFAPQLEHNERNTKVPLIIYYHGWSSCRVNQRFIGAVLSSFGYLVLLPDALYHGERGHFENYEKALYEYFLPTVMQNLADFHTLKDYMLENYNADKERIAVAGHSMGGYSSAGIFTHNGEVKTAVVFNGAFDWQNAILETGRRYRMPVISFDKAEKSADPACNREKIIDRPIFILHGKKDTFVPFEVQKQFYQQIREQYRNKDLIKFMSVERMNHYISVQMFNEAIMWFSKHL